MLEKYLKFRFITNNVKHYHGYFDEWVSGLTETQINYFEREMENLINNGKYDPAR